MTQFPRSVPAGDATRLLSEISPRAQPGMGVCRWPGRRAGSNGSRGRSRTHAPSPHSKGLPGAQPAATLVPLLVAERRHSPDFLLLLHPRLEPALPLPCRPAGWDNVLDIDRAWSADGISMARGLNCGDGPEHSVIVRFLSLVSGRRGRELRSSGNRQGRGQPAGRCWGRLGVPWRWCWLRLRAGVAGGLCRLRRGGRLCLRQYFVTQLGNRLWEGHRLGRRVEAGGVGDGTSCQRRKNASSFSYSFPVRLARTRMCAMTFS